MIHRAHRTAYLLRVELKFAECLDLAELLQTGVADIGETRLERHQLREIANVFYKKTTQRVKFENSEFLSKISF